MIQATNNSQEFASLLVEDGLIARKDWNTALSIQQSQGGRLIEILMGLCPISEEVLYQAIARQLSLPFWFEHELTALVIESELIQKFPLFLMMEHSFLPIKLESSSIPSLHLVLPNPLDQTTLDAIKLYAQVDHLAIGISTPSSLINAIQLHYRQTLGHGGGEAHETHSEGSVTPSRLPSARLFSSNASSYVISPPKIEMRTCPACEHPEPITSDRCTRCGSPMNLAQADPLIGKHVGRFRLDRKLGEGGMGLVYMSQDLESNQEAAVKILRTHLSTNERVVRRFHREARAQNELRHPNIVYVHDFGFEEGVGFYIAMEFLQGMSLEVLLEEKSEMLSLDLIRAIFQQVCDAMGFAHSRGIFHRDLKPDNIFLLENPWRSVSEQRLKILDFGVAKMVASDEDQRLTRTGMTIGTPRYMAPEQAGEGNSDHRADIYSLGVILFEVLTGQPPFEGSSAYQIMLRHVYADPPSLSHVRSDLPYPPEIEDLVKRMLAKDPQERPASMDMLWHELSASLDRFGTFIAPDLPLLHSSHRRKEEEAPSTMDRPVIVGRMLKGESETDGVYSSEPVHHDPMAFQDATPSGMTLSPLHEKRKQSSSQLRFPAVRTQQTERQSSHPYFSALQSESGRPSSSLRYSSADGNINSPASQRQPSHLHFPALQPGAESHSGRQPSQLRYPALQPPNPESNRRSSHLHFPALQQNESPSAPLFPTTPHSNPSSETVSEKRPRVQPRALRQESEEPVQENITLYIMIYFCLFLLGCLLSWWFVLA